MMHLPVMIQDLAIILITAALMALLFRVVRQPVVLGYIVAGFLVGPHFSWIPTIVETESIKVWAEIGVIFLLFALGLEFSFKKLARVGSPAAITAIIEVAGMSALGFLAGKAFGWSNYDSIFLGGILSISSTTIIVKALDELELKAMGFVKLVFGVLIIEDLFAILLMVILSTIAATHKFSGITMGVASLKLVFFLSLWFVFGIFLIPSFLKRVRNHVSSETLLIVALGLCFLIVVVASNSGFSPALGAFIMGSILAETEEGERIEHIVEPVKNLFGAVFFVSVGMLIDPGVLVQHWLPILVITMITAAGKILTSTVGALIAGQSLRHAVQAGFSLAQIGEFSFIIAGLGLSLKVTSDFLYPIAISVSAITTFMTPYLIRSSGKFATRLEEKIPSRWITYLDRFRANTVKSDKTTEWETILKLEAVTVGANTVVVTAFFLACSEFLLPWLRERQWAEPFPEAISLFAAVLLSAPFLWAVAGRRINWANLDPAISQWGVPGALFAFHLLRGFFVMVLCAVLASRIVAPLIAVIIVVPLLVVNLLVLSRFFAQIYGQLEKRFVQNLNEKELKERSRSVPRLAPWESHLAELKVSPDSLLVGRTFFQLGLRERFGVTIALVQRGHTKIAAPGRDTVLYPGDVLQVIGSDAQIDQFRRECEAVTVQADSQSGVDYVLQAVFVTPEAPYANKSIRESGVREKANGLVVGIEKQNQRTLNPDSSMVIEPGDVLWIVGDQGRMATL